MSFARLFRTRWNGNPQRANARHSRVGNDSPRAFRPRLEALEDRLAPSCTSRLEATVVTVNCDDAADGILLYSNGESALTVVTNVDDPRDFSQVTGLFVNAGGGDDRIFVLNLSVTNTQINGGAGNDTFNLGDNTNRLRQLGNLTLDGGPDNNMLNINDQGTQSPESYTLTDTLFMRTAGVGRVNYGNFTTLDLKVGTTRETINVQGSPQGTVTTITGGAGNDTVNLGDDTNRLRHRGTLRLNGGDGDNVFTINDQGSSDQTYNLTDTLFTRTAGVGPVEYSNFINLALNVGAGRETINIQGSPQEAVTTITGGAGDDTVIVGDATGRLRLRGPLNLNGASGGNTLRINDQGTQTQETYTLTDTLFRRSGVVPITYSNFTNLALNVGTFNETINVQNSLPGTVTTITGGAGNDIFNLGDSTNRLRHRGTLTLDGGAGTNTLNVNDQGTDTQQTYSLSADQFTRTNGVGQVTYRNFTTLALNVGTFNETVNVQNSLPGISIRIIGGAGNDTFNLGDSTNRLRHQGPLTLDGGAGTNTLNINDQGTQTQETYTLTSTQFTRTAGIGPVNYVRFGALALNAGTAGERVSVQSTAAGTTTTINGGAGNDTLDAGTGLIGALAGPLTVNGQGGTDTLNVNDRTTATPQNYVVTSMSVSWGGAGQITYGTVERLVLNGGRGGNTLVVQGSAANTVVALSNGTFRVTTNSSVANAFELGDAATLQVPAGVMFQSGNDALLNGTVTVANTGAFRSGGSATVGGMVDVAAGGTLAASGRVVLAPSSGLSPGGTLTGVGTVDANVTNNGTVRPGSSLGILTITGSYTQTVTGTLAVELGGLTAGTQYDRLVVGGAAALNGALRVAVVSGFAPAPDNRFTVITFATRSGDFAVRTGLDLGGGRTLSPVFAAGDLTLAIPGLPPPTSTLTGTLQLSDAAYTVAHGPTTARIQVVRTGGSSGRLSIPYATSDGTAQAGADYVPATGNLVFEAGETSKEFAVTILDDGKIKTSRTVRLALGQNQTMQTALLTIADNVPVVADSPRPANLGVAALGFAKSREQYTNLVTAAYDRYLKRQPDAAGLEGWVNALLTGGLTEERLEAGFIGSPEYIANHGGQGRGWIVGMYKDLLGRDPAEAEVQGWLERLAAGVTEAQVAYGFAASTEREGQRVQRNYRTYLDRDASPQEVQGWVALFAQGATTNQDIVAGFVGSPEYYASPSKGRGNKAVWVVRAYEQVLFRAPARSELNGWVDFLR